MTIAKDFLKLLFNPGKTKETPPAPIASIVMLILSVAAFALAFQYLYPRIQDRLPIIGGLRRATSWLTGSSHPLVDGRLAFRWLLAGILFVVAWLVPALAAAALARKGAILSRALDATAAAAAPLLWTSILGVVLFPMHYAMGLAPVGGLLVGAFVLALILAGREGLPGTIAALAGPAVWGLQLYAIYALRP